MAWTSLLDLMMIRIKLHRWLSRRDYFFHELPDVDMRAHDRSSYVLDLARGQRVLHLGFADVPFTREKLAERTHLHDQLRGVAARAFGVDMSQEAVDAYRDLTGDLDNVVADVLEDDAAGVPDEIDLILLGEILEHLGDPLRAMLKVRELASRYTNCRVCVTVPNAFAAGGFLAAARGVEIVNPDHYAYYSPVTLRNLMRDAGFDDIEIHLYTFPKTRRAPGITKDGVIGIGRVG